MGGVICMSSVGITASVLAYSSDFSLGEACIGRHHECVYIAMCVKE